MQWRKTKLLSGMICWALVTSASAQNKRESGKDESSKGEKAAAAKIGDAAPAFELKGADGKTYRLADYKDKLVVLEWFNQDCPFSRGAQARIKELSEKYKAKGVVWLAVDSTNYQTAEKDAKFAQENSLPHPILLDADGKVGKLYGARKTPHMFVISKGKLVYAGALDNDPQKNKKADEYRGYVAEALDAVMAGKDVPLVTSEPWGCSVKYKGQK